LIFVVRQTRNNVLTLSFLYIFSKLVAPGQSFVGRTATQLEMRHRKGFKQLSKPADQRKALLRALTTEVVRHGRIKTTLVRAKAVRKHVDHMIELGKRGDLHARRQALGWIYDKNLVASLFDAAPERYGSVVTLVCYEQLLDKVITPRWR
jgi:large subunit ribosomal protein L17